MIAEENNNGNSFVGLEGVSAQTVFVGGENNNGQYTGRKTVNYSPTIQNKYDRRESRACHSPL
jgi:hypothetical protein